MPNTIDMDALESIDREWNDRLRECRATMLPAQLVLLYLHPGNWEEQLAHQQEADAMRNALLQGTKPSEYVKTLRWLFGRLTLPEHEPLLLNALDRLLELPYDTGYDRRSFRCRSAQAYLERTRQLMRMFSCDTTLAQPLTAILQGLVPIKEWDFQLALRQGTTLPFRIAAALDARDEAAERLVREILLGDGAQNVIRQVIHGVLYSHREDLYPLVGQLLVAARLQEGLRSAICEAADQGQLAAFRYLIDVIVDHDLIRFSGVKRAVGCWLGLLNQETRDLERISSKSLQLVQRCLRDMPFLAECLKGEDAMEIYIALWTMGVHDVSAAAQAVLRLAQGGSHHQVLVAGVFLENLHMPELQERICVAVILSHPEETDIQAVYLRQLQERFGGIGWEKKKYELHKAPDMARRLCEHLLALRRKVGKGLTFSPCVFPWHSEGLSKAGIALVALAAACISQDDALLDACCPLLAECDPFARDDVLRSCYAAARTPKQHELVLRSLCDKSESTRREATKIVREWTLSAADNAILVELLRYKYGDVRQTLTALLLRQEDDALFATVQTLLGDKSEERRMAGLSIVKQLTEEGQRPLLAQRCTALASGMQEGSGKAHMVLTGIEQKAEQLYGPEDVYVPELPLTPSLLEAVNCYGRYFPDAALMAEMKGEQTQNPESLLSRRTTLDQTETDLSTLIALYRENLLTPVPERDGALLNSLTPGQFWEGELPLRSLWEGWYEKTLQSDPTRLVRMIIRRLGNINNHFQDALERAYGEGWAEQSRAVVDATPPNGLFGMGGPGGIANNLTPLLAALLRVHVPREDLTQIGLALLSWIALHVENKDLCAMDKSRWTRISTLMDKPQIRFATENMLRTDGQLLKLEIDARWMITSHCLTYMQAMMKMEEHPTFGDRYARRGGYLSSALLLRGVCAGLFSARMLYAWLVEVAHPSEAKTLLSISAFYRAKGKDNANHTRWSNNLHTQKRIVQEFLGHEPTEATEDQRLLAQVDGIVQPFLRAIVDAELHRGDAQTLYSPFVPSVSRLEGAPVFTTLLSALGKDKLVRHDSWSFDSRAECISHLLSTCVPLTEETAQDLRACIAERRLSQERMIEAGLYCPEWLPLLEEALAIPGLTCAAYYFIAHMKEDNDQVRQAYIARYTPLTGEELTAGAFDIAWFRRAYTEVGETVFDQLYAAAKYITSGGRHSRARKYADAVLGRITLEELAAQIVDKRNQDTLMAYPLVPLTGDADLRARYLFIQDFLKGSKKFGAQRIASEKQAAAMAMTNLAANAGYADAMRLILRMEAGMMDELRPLMSPQTVGDVVLALTIDAEGKAEIRAERGGKVLKSIPASIKKAATIPRLTEAKKLLLDQHKRTRAMLENAMEDETAFTVEELSNLMSSEVLSPLLRKVVFLHGETAGVFDGQNLETVEGTRVPLQRQDEIIIAHPYHLWVRKQWLPWQRKLYASRTVQPFRQVFRELYVMTPEEAKSDVSKRCAGHQIQPGKAFACLKTRRWVADPEAGLQRVDYRRNIVSVMLALGDWFTPADIEAPTLEAVLFADRLTGRRLSLAEVPPVLFSETMRDMDLAVSVAHAGGVDPEASHSTMEMRGMLLEMVLPLFHLSNVVLRDRHAIITGKLASYTVHLGSGVVHQVGGTMLNILPVHSAQRGRIFLPFADQDPQTAEVLSKVLVLAEDGKIKDPTILEQIRQNG